MGIFSIGKKPVALPPAAKPQAAAKSAQASTATGFSGASSFASSSSAATASSSVFTNPAVTGPLSQYMNTINGPTATDKNSSTTKIGVAELSALTNPALAKQLLSRGVTDPSTGAQLTPPIDPKSSLGQALTKVANGTATASDITTAASQVKDKTVVGNSLTDNIFAQEQATTQQLMQQMNQQMQDSDDD